MKNKTAETAASLSVYEFAEICKQVDREFDGYFQGVFAQKRTYDKAVAYTNALASPDIQNKTSWAIAEHCGYDTPARIQSLRLIQETAGGGPPGR